MPERKFVVAASFCSAVFFAALIFIALLYLAKNVPNVSRVEGERRVEMFGNVDLTSGFTSTRDNVGVVFVKLNNFVKRNRGEFIFSIKDKNGGTLRKVQISGENIGADEWVKFQFPPLTGIKGSELTLVLHSDARSAGESIIAYTDTDGNFLFKSFAKDEFVKASLDGFRNFYTRFSQDVVFTALYIVFLTGNLIFFLKIRKARD